MRFLLLTLALLSACVIRINADLQRADRPHKERVIHIEPEPELAHSAADLAGRRPNIVFVYTDDHATAAIGTYGSPHALTPRLDRLADEGLRFDRAFCTNGICAPARAVVLTGKHSHINGVEDNGDTFDGAQDTFPKALQAAGYATALFGKWHLKSDPTGFDRWRVLWGQGNYYSPRLLGPEGEEIIDGYATEIVTDLALEWLDEERDPEQPFLLMVQHKAPHRTWMPNTAELELFAELDLPEPATLFDDYSGRASGAANQEMTIAQHMWMHYDLKVPPVEGEPGFANKDELDGPDRWAAGLEDRMNPEQRAAWEAAFGPRNAAFRAARDAGELEGDDLTRWKYQRYIKNYLRCIKSVDTQVGRLVDYLDANDLAEDTVFIYSSDQGFYLGEHGWYDKRWMYEPSLRLPLIVRWPGTIEAGRSDTHLVQNLDLAPTLLELAGAAPFADIQGRSMAPLLAGEPDPDWRDAIYYEYFEVGIHAVPPHHGVRTDQHKLIHYHMLDEWELFDLDADPDELSSVYAEPAYAAVRAELEQRLVELREHYRR